MNVIAQSSTELLVSADSHVMESADLWQKRLPSRLRKLAPRYVEDPKVNIFAHHDGGRDPEVRLKEMAIDGVSAEVLYPTRALDQFGLENAELQEGCFRVYNDWLQEYCAIAPERLFSIACIAAYRIQAAVKEVERTKCTGSRGILLWQTPPADYSFATHHYEPLWEVAQALDMPVSLHILSGAPFAPGVALQKRAPGNYVNFVITQKLAHAMTALVDIITSGVFDRFPRLKLVLVENEVSWLPFFISQFDKYTGEKYRAKFGSGFQLKRKPSDYFGTNIFATFFNDPPASRMLEEWGGDAWMWSNDFPHPNSTWPNSREVIKRDMSGIPEAVRAKLVRENCARVYSMGKIPALA